MEIFLRWPIAKKREMTKARFELWLKLYGTYEYIWDKTISTKPARTLGFKRLRI